MRVSFNERFFGSLSSLLPAGTGPGALGPGRAVCGGVGCVGRPAFCFAVPLSVGDGDWMKLFSYPTAVARAR